MPSVERPKIEGLGARLAALHMIDAVLRRGQTLDFAATTARNLRPADKALAIAIAGEALRRLPDLDALIDSATRQRLPPRHSGPCRGRDRAAAG
jgi:16S rRNA (cytosine967-C5)-methyltransferase